MLRYLEGSLPPDELEQLNRAVEDDPATRREMAELMLQQTLLTKLGQESEFFELQPPEPVRETRRISIGTTRIIKIERAPSARRSVWTATAAAAALLLTFSMFLSVGEPRPKVSPVAVVTPVVEPAPSPEATPTPEPARPPAVSPATSPSDLPAKPAPSAVTKTPDPRKSPAPSDRRNPTTPEEMLQPMPKTPVVTRVPPAPVAPSDNPLRVETSFAKVESIQGDVYVLAGASRRVAKVGGVLPWGYGVETSATGGSAVLRYPDGTRVELAPRTVVWDASDKPGARHSEGIKRLRIMTGTITADVTPQPEQRPLLLTSLHGEVKVLGTSFKLTMNPDGMRIEVKEGKVRATRRDDQVFVDVEAGFYAVVGSGLSMDVKASPK